MLDWFSILYVILSDHTAFLNYTQSTNMWLLKSGDVEGGAPSSCFVFVGLSVVRVKERYGPFLYI